MKYDFENPESEEKEEETKVKNEEKKGGGKESKRKEEKFVFERDEVYKWTNYIEDRIKAK